jgi:hypothetical protein
MGKVLKISLILVTIVLSFYSLSFGGQLEKGILPTNFSHELIYGQWILNQKGDLPFSLFEKAGSINTLYGDMPIETIRNREFSLKPEVTNSSQSPATTDIQKMELSHFKNGQLLKEKSSYHFGKTHLPGDNLDYSSNFNFSLSLAKYKEENTLSWTLERFKENDIIKSLAILLELNLNF